jgi:hypothetical protein
MKALLFVLFAQLIPYQPCCTQDVSVDMIASEGIPINAEWRIMINGQLMREPVAWGLAVTLLVPCGQYQIWSDVKYRHEFSIWKDGFEDGSLDWQNKPHPNYSDTWVSPIQRCQPQRPGGGVGTNYLVAWTGDSTPLPPLSTL